MTKILLWNLLTFYVDDHVWIFRKLIYRCFMLSLSFQGGLFNLLGFVVERNSATNSLRSTVRKKAEKWGRKVILACIPKNLHMNEHVCTSLCAKKIFFFHYIKWKSSVCRGKISEKSIYSLGSSWFHWNSGKSKATGILVISVFTGQSSFRHSTHSAPQLSGLEQLSPKLPLQRSQVKSMNLAGNAGSLAMQCLLPGAQAGSLHHRTILTWTSTPHPTNILCKYHQHRIHWNFVTIRS